ncbi:helix-turn-helix transcriptional regulator [Haliangium ochraceum]|uniref:Transcriptional regulator, LuxR family n=1 Tax=Haliangium ochraceum (strain DSM 14365 / JCM 11303 / SMP-2) TaxID=502025 RepID=D0LMQ6_HALO1|nr:LuxR C-terminal-related transcriptional regulator [Haliangium ochraceum]ACY18743.1 transcriptional regulator, LuxR family [Haliangium ochraceum DSM 14365]
MATRERSFDERISLVAGELQSLRSHGEFIQDLLRLLSDLIPNDLLSYNEMPDVDAEFIGTWDGDALLKASIAEWTPAAAIGGLSVEQQRECAVHYVHEHPGMLRGGRTAYRNSDLIETSVWQRSELYNQLHRPMGIESQLSAHLPALPGRLITLSFNRRRGDFSDTEVHHLQRVAQMLSPRMLDHWSYLSLLRERAHWRHLADDTEDCSYILLSPTWRIRWLSRHAERWLRDYGLAPSRQRLPPPVLAWLEPVRGRRRSMVPPLRLSVAGGTLSFTYLPDDTAGAMIRLHRTRQPAVQAADADADAPQTEVLCRSIVDAFRLTPREAEVALWISRGKSNQDIATILSIRPGTVKKHAERIFMKLGVENRASVVTVVHSAVATPLALALMRTPGN